MITLSWVESEIEKSLRGEASAKNVYDLAEIGRASCRERV